MAGMLYRFVPAFASSPDGDANSKSTWSTTHGKKKPMVLGLWVECAICLRAIRERTRAGRHAVRLGTEADILPA